MSDPVSVSLTSWQRACRSLLLRALAGLGDGCLRIDDRDGRHVLGQGKEVRVHVHDGSFYPAALLEQSSGVGRAYMEGWWTCEDPVGLVRLLARNEKAIRRWTAPRPSATPALPSSSRRSSRSSTRPTPCR